MRRSGPPKPNVQMREQQPHHHGNHYDTDNYRQSPAWSKRRFVISPLTLGQIDVGHRQSSRSFPSFQQWWLGLPLVRLFGGLQLRLDFL